jgi:hypothetical protein
MVYIIREQITKNEAKYNLHLTNQNCAREIIQNLGNNIREKITIMNENP